MFFLLIPIRYEYIIFESTDILSQKSQQVDTIPFKAIQSRQDLSRRGSLQHDEGFHLEGGYCSPDLKEEDYQYSNHAEFQFPRFVLEDSLLGGGSIRPFLVEDAVLPQQEAFPLCPLESLQIL